jgi:hypothetical protein
MIAYALLRIAARAHSSRMGKRSVTHQAASPPPPLIPAHSNAFSTNPQTHPQSATVRHP